MTVIKTALLWVLALVVAVWAIWRLARRRKALVDGHWSPRFVHMVAVLFVALGGCRTRQPRDPGPPKSADAAPLEAVAEPTVTLGNDPPAALANGLQAHFELTADGGALPLFTAAMIAGEWDQARGWGASAGNAPGSQPLADALGNLGRDRAAGLPPTADEIDRLLAAAEAVPVYYAPFAAMLWRELAAVKDAIDPVALAGILHRIEEQHRMSIAIQRAVADTGPVTFRPWLKKSMPPRGYSALNLPPGLDDAVRRAYAAVDSGSWASEAVLPLQLQSGDAQVALHRSGQRVVLRPGTKLRLRRLDVVAVSRGSATFHNLIGGELTIPPDRVLVAWDVERYLTPAGRAAIDDLAGRALGGDETAVNTLEANLPLAQAAIRRALGSDPDAAGAPQLRLLLALFDE